MPIRSSATSFRRRLGMHWRGGRHSYGGSRSKCYFSAFTPPSVSWRGKVVRGAPPPYLQPRKTARGVGAAPILKEKSVPIAGPAQTTITQEELALAKTLGEKILDQIGLDRQCVILTGAPNSFLDSPAIAMALAASLRTNSIFPPIDGLSTLDGAHL